MIVLLIIVDIIFFFLAIKKPTLFVIFYILATAKFLGFFSLTIFIINGTDLGFFSINMLALISIFFKKWSLIRKEMLLLWGTFILIILYGIFFPIINGYETLKQAIISSKPFLFLFFFYYIVVNFDKINVFKIINLMKFLSVYLSIVEIVYTLISIGPPFYIDKYDYLGNYVRIYYPTYISLGWFLFYIDYLYEKIDLRYFIFISLISLLGLIIAGHSALTIMTLASLSSLWLFFYKNNHKFSSFKFFKNTVIISIIIAIVLSLSTELRNSVEAILTGSDTALSSREIYNKFRWEAINKSPVIGYGFIHKKAAIMKSFHYDSKNRFSEKLGVQDSGYVDLFVRFGYLGSFLYLFIIFQYLLYFYRLKHKNYYLLPLIMFLLQYFFLNYTWSVFSFPFGTIPMIITFLILFKFKNIYIIKK